MCVLVFGVLIFSGCVDSPSTEEDKIGWNQAKYDEYSLFYDKSINKTCIDRNKLCVPQQETQSLVYEIEDRQDYIQPDRNEFDKIWYQVFSNYRRGFEIYVKAQDTGCIKIPLYGASAEVIRRNRKACNKYDELFGQAMNYFNKSKESRQIIEELRT